MILFLCRLLRLLGILRSFQGIYLEGGIRLLLGSYTACWVVALGPCCNRRGVFCCVTR